MKEYFHLTLHARRRMAERGVYYEDIMFAVRYGDVVVSGADLMYVLRSMRRFRGDNFPPRLVALVQKRRPLSVILTLDKMVKTAFWLLSDKKKRRRLQNAEDKK